MLGLDMLTLRIIETIMIMIYSAVRIIFIIICYELFENETYQHKELKLTKLLFILAIIMLCNTELSNTKLTNIKLFFQIIEILLVLLIIIQMLVNIYIGWTIFKKIRIERKGKSTTDTNK